MVADSATNGVFHVGTYVLGEADTTERLAPEASLHPKIPGMQPSNDSPAVFIDSLPDCGYLFKTMKVVPKAAAHVSMSWTRARRYKEFSPSRSMGIRARFISRPQGIA
jgi:hypothetical protein